MEWYRILFVDAIKAQIKDKDGIETEFKSLLYENICISLFEQDKLLFSFLMGLKLMSLDKIIDQKLIRFLMTGGVATENKTPVPQVNDEIAIWFNKIVWTKIEEMDSTIELFKGFSQKFKNNLEAYNDIFVDDKVMEKELPGVADNINLNIKGTKEQKQFYKEILE